MQEDLKRNVATSVSQKKPKNRSRLKLAIPFSLVIASLAYQPSAMAIGFGGVLKVAGVVCSVAGVLIEGYQLSKCNSNLPQNLAQSTLTYNGNRFNFNLGFVGGDFDSDNLNQVISGTFGEGVMGVNGVFAVTEAYWNWQIILDENAGNINDVLTINGHIQHVLASPHDTPIDNGSGEMLPFNLIVDADNAKNGKVRDKEEPVSLTHPGLDFHSDTLTKAKLTATVTTTGFFDDITGYTFTSNAQHKTCPANPRLQAERAVTCQQVPEPSSVLATIVFGSIVSASIFLKRKRQGLPNQFTDSTTLDLT
jgi:hypothetical protein